jgi:A/G-specific adenine glycosylase
MGSTFTSNLLDWNMFRNKRHMPWKGESDPYRIWLSEIILQQTRVEQGWAYYERFINSFPDVHALANAPDQEVYKLWEGLGYYSRCRNLITTAKVICEKYNGVFPSAYDEIIHLKGIGPYTAAAISSFAFNERRAVVDGNVHRVLARYFGIYTPVDTGAGKSLFNKLAGSLIDEASPATYNQAIMDFGATVCKPRNPACPDCIFNTDCHAYLNDCVHQLPVKQKILKIKNRWLYYFIIENDDEVYIRKRNGNDIWQNLHEFVLLESPEEHETTAKTFLGKLLQHRYSIISESGVHMQQLTHQKIKGKFIRVRTTGRPIIHGNYQLVKKSHLNEYAFPRFINSFLEKEFLTNH